MSKFQFIFIGIFILFLIGGVVAFATYKSNDAGTDYPAITVWGTFPSDVFNLYVSQVNNTLNQTISINYVQKKPEQFSSDFVAALARGSGPDAILIPADMLLPHEDKLALVPYSAFPKAEYKASYIQEGDIYLNQNGILAIPFTVDPLIMYWNRDTFDASGVATYPRYWDEFANLNKRMTQKDQNGNIRKSALALGEMSNIANSREILATLLLQSGNPIVTESEGRPVSALKTSFDPSPVAALEFFSKSVNPSSPEYSWNKSMPNSKTAFLSGILSTYFGFASELKDIQAKNPNLNFDAAPMPQARSGTKATYGRMYGFSIVRASANPNAVYQIVSILTAPKNLAELSKSMYLPTVRRDVISEGADDQYIGIFNDSALISRTWIDADPNQSRTIFSDLVQSLTSGRKSVYEALQDASDQYDLILTQALGADQLIK